MKIIPSQINNLCLLRLSAIGDVCHAVAMVQAIQRQFPHIKITWIIGKIEYQLLKHLANVEFIIFDKSQGWKSFLKLKKDLKDRQFDVLLHMQAALRASIASLMIPAKIKVGFDRQRAWDGQWLFTHTKIEPQVMPHVLDGFMAFAQKIGVEDIRPTWDIPVTNDDTHFAQQQINDGDKTLIICPAASKAERNWLPERYAAIADYAHSKGMKVLLCGGPSQLEKDLSASIMANARSEIINLVGKTSLLQMLALLKEASIVLAPDTGPAHMAVTQGTPVIGLYAHSNPKRTGPYLYPQYVANVYPQAIAKQFAGKTEDMLPWGTRAKGDDLMNMISIDQVKNIFDKILDNI